MLFAGQVFVQLISMILGILVARNLGKSTYGQYSLAFIFAGIFSAFYTFGTDPILVRQIAKSTSQKYNIINSAFWIRIAGLPLTLILVTTGGFLARYSLNQRFYIVLAAVMGGFIAIGDIPRMVLQGLQRMEFDALTRVVEKFLALLLVGISLLIALNLTVVLVSLVISSLLGTLFSWIVLEILIKHRLEFIFNDSLALLRQSLPLTGSMLLVGLYMRLPQVILSFYRPVSEVGLYSAAYNTLYPFTFLPIAFTSTFLPVLSSIMETSQQSVNKLYETLLAYTFMIGLPLAAGLGLFSRDIIKILFGGDYLPASHALAILSPYIFLYFFEMQLYNILIASGGQKKIFIVASVNLVSVIILNIIMVPRLGLTGTSLSVVISEIISLSIMLYLTSCYVKHRLSRKSISSILAVGLMLVGGVATGPLSIWLRAPLLVILYGLGLLITGGVAPHDIRYVFTILTKSSHKG